MGSYLPQSYLLHEEMVVTERLHHVDQLGYYIYSLCRGKETFKLQRRERIIGTALTLLHILHWYYKWISTKILLNRPH